MKQAYLIITLSSLCISGWTEANALDEKTVIENTRTQELLTSRLEQSKASEWGLKVQEWQRYRELMEGPLGVYSPGIDPLTALGLEARDSEERKRYTEMQAHAEYQRITKLFAYQNAYDEAFARLYPNLLPVNLIGAGNTAQSSPVTAPARLMVFVSIDCKGCVERVKRLQSADHHFDLYLVGARGNDELIRGWANTAGIDPKKVRSRDITLNHDNGRWASLGDGGPFPAVMRQVNGQWQRH
ncbi:TIGR03759 family integrating conjugative element protein [Pseudomonas fluorescens BBc6R8]|uniref:TIGR03759 family integrating conjugative element protein n=1 Tax=Pseudomonas fluorescens TaxID=294 RepID=UPI000281C8D0|nr:TIGR03759 family integrating conjugative element protein [Pseudomonas fluorescens]QQD55376.1 TIGR03759 family integrating conjugative element protein [Pseudomonas fluorescens BBc6R8]